MNISLVFEDSAALVDDSSNAFDCVSLEILLEKLGYYTFSNHNCRQSDLHPFKFGLPHSSIIVLLLFF